MSQACKNGPARAEEAPVMISGRGRNLDLKGASERMKRENTQTAGSGQEADDKRKSQRQYLVAEVRLKVPGSEVPVYAMAVNISETGIGIYTNRAVELGSRIAVKITVLIKGTLIVSEEVSGSVRWVEPIDKNFAAGIRFEEAVTDESHPVLARCLEYARSSERPERG